MIFQKPGATIDTPENLLAAQHLQRWIENGYFPPDINAIEYTDANARFGQGEGVFIFNGDWQNAGYDTDLPGKVGFFLMPPLEAGGAPAAMSAPLTFGIAANAKNPIVPPSSSTGLLQTRQPGRSALMSVGPTLVARQVCPCRPSLKAPSLTRRSRPE